MGLPAVRQGEAIMARLVKLSPDDAGWKSDLARFGVKLLI
jgi:hypothetical protein